MHPFQISPLHASVFKISLACIRIEIHQKSTFGSVFCDFYFNTGFLPQPKQLNTDACNGEIWHGCMQPETLFSQMCATDIWATDACKVWAKSRMRATYIPDARNPSNPVDQDSPTGEYGRYRRSMPIHLRRITANTTWFFESSKLKARTSLVQCFDEKRLSSFWALSFETAFENVTPSGIGCIYRRSIVDCRLKMKIILWSISSTTPV